MKNEKNKLDDIDLKILNELQMNGDITNVQLAKTLKKHEKKPKTA